MGNYIYQKNENFVFAFERYTCEDWQTGNLLKMFLEWFSFECRKTENKVITLASHKEHRQYSEHVADAKCRKMHASASRLVLVLLLIG